MRKLFVLGLVVGALALLASPVMAITFKSGENLGKFNNYDSFLTPSGAPIKTQAPAVGDLDVTIGLVTTLYNSFQQDPSKEYYSNTGPSSQQLSLMFYDLAVSSVTPIPKGIFNPAGDKMYVVTIGSAGNQTSLGYTGGRWDIYENPTSPFTESVPSNWSVSHPVSGNPFDPGNFDTFPTASVGTPILSGTLVDADATGAELTFLLDYTNGTGGLVGYGYLDVLYNPGAVAFETTTRNGVSFQITTQNTFAFFGSGLQEPVVDNPNTDPIFWNAESNDPFKFSIASTAIPEPATLTLLGSGLVGLIGILRRRSK
jgi:hypothetical protein